MSMIGSNDKLKQAAAGAAGGGGPLDVDDVFSTYLYTGNNLAQTFTNGIDLAGEGGLVWIKARTSAYEHVLVDTERGVNKALYTNLTAAEASSQTVSAFNSNGFSIPNAASYTVTNSGTNFASWTFRKAPKFFDVVTYTGNGGSSKTINHNLGATPGMIWIKSRSNNDRWLVWHKDLTATSDYYMYLNETDQQSLDASNSYFISAPTSTSFEVGSGYEVNQSGSQFVAYIFAHNDGDGEFGPNGDQDIIKCGSFTTASSVQMQSIDVGFEPQFVLLKCASSSDNWMMIDVMRGAPTVSVYTGDSARLRANLTAAESTDTVLHPTATGFDYRIDNTSSEYIYMAIRRGPLAPPESATDVFAVVGGGFPATSGFPVDSVLSTYFETYANNHMLYDRLRATDGSRLLFTHSNAAENTSNPFSLSIASNTGVERSWGSGWNHKMFRRAPGFFDVVAYTGAGSNQTLKHNLTVKPELSIVKYRTGSYSISAYTSWGTNTLTDGTNNPTLFLDSDRATIGSTNAYWQEATDTEIYVGGANNENSFTYIMYLFATLAGISKVGKYTGNGSSQTINCGFTSGARYVLIKRYDSAGDWYVWDTARGIVAGNDPYMRLNVTTGEVTSNDSIDPASSGFIVNQVAATNINVSSAKYVFYAIA